MWSPFQYHESVHVDFKMDVSGIRLQEYIRTCDEQEARLFVIQCALRIIMGAIGTGTDR
jgi:hypothetical protein